MVAGVGALLAGEWERGSWGADSPEVPVSTAEGPQAAPRKGGLTIVGAGSEDLEHAHRTPAHVLLVALAGQEGAEGERRPGGRRGLAAGAPLAGTRGVAAGEEDALPGGPAWRGSWPRQQEDGPGRGCLLTEPRRALLGARAWGGRTSVLPPSDSGGAFPTRP